MDGELPRAVAEPEEQQGPKERAQARCLPVLAGVGRGLGDPALAAAAPASPWPFSCTGGCVREMCWALPHTHVRW